jgi:hypothetical protein
MATTTVMSGKGSGAIAAAADAVVILCPGAGSVSLSVAGTWTGTLAFYISGDDGTSWTAVAARTVGTSSSSASTTTANGLFVVPVQGQQRVKVEASAWSTGSATVSAEASPAPAVTPPVSLDVATVAALPTPAQATWAYVRSNGGFYFYNPSTAAWERQFIASTRWQAVSAWYLDSVNGNDENDGQTSGTPLKTVRELASRMGGVIARTTTVYILNTTTPWPLSDDWGQLSLRVVQDRPSYGNGDTALQIIGVQTTVRTSSFTSAWAVTSGNTGPTLTDTGTANFAADIGTLCVATSGAANNGLAWFLKDMGSNTARMSTFKQPGFTNVTATVPGNGDTYKTCTLTPYAGQTLPTVQGPATSASVFVLFRNIEFQLAVCPQGPANFMYAFQECKFDAQPTFNTAVDVRGCYFAAGAQSVSPRADYKGSCNCGSGPFVVTKNAVHVDADTILQGGSNGWSLADMGYAELTRCGAFDSSGRGVLAANANFKGVTSLFGSGNLVGFSLQRGTARINFVPTLTGTTELQLDGATTALPKLVASASVPATVSISTWSNWSTNTSKDARNLSMDSFIRGY